MVGQPHSLGPIHHEACAGGGGRGGGSGSEAPATLLAGGPAAGGARWKSQDPSLAGQPWPSFSQGPALLAAILVIEFIYAIVGIVWLTQYYTSCNDLTAKNVTLGMSRQPRGRRDRSV